MLTPASNQDANGASGAWSYALKSAVAQATGAKVTKDATTGKAKVEATATGNVIFIMSRVADIKYAAPTNKEITVTFLNGVAISTPAAVAWGTAVTLTPSGGGAGALSYVVKSSTASANKSDISLSASTGNSTTVSGTTQPGTVVVTVTRAAAGANPQSSKEVTLTFNRKASLVVLKPAITSALVKIAAGNSYDLSTAIAGNPAGASAQTFTYAEKTDANNIGTLTASSVAIISGATTGQQATYTLTAVQNKWYAAKAIDLTIQIPKAAQAKPGTEVTLSKSTEVWGTAVTISNHQSAQEYQVVDATTGAVFAGITVTSDKVNATKAGIVKVQTRFPETSNKEASDWTAGITLTFSKKATTVSLTAGKDTISQKAGTTYDLNTSFTFASGTSKADYPTITYVKKSGQSWAINSSTGVVTIPASASANQNMIITVTYEGTKYANFNHDITITVPDAPLTTGSGATLLTWSGDEGAEVSLAAAKTTCSNLTKHGKSNWRIPTKAEFELLATTYLGGSTSNSVWNNSRLKAKGFYRYNNWSTTVNKYGDYNYNFKYGAGDPTVATKATCVAP